VLSKDKQKEYSPIEITVYYAIFTLILSVILIPLESGHFVIPPSNALFSILYSGIAGTALFYLLYQYAIKISSPLIASMVLYLEPIFTFIWAIFLLGEKITIGLIAGMVLVLIGVYIASVQKRRNETLKV
jgi:drug/metabolite transporter (DMT)-like permease